MQSPNMCTDTPTYSKLLRKVREVEAKNQNVDTTATGPSQKKGQILSWLAQVGEMFTEEEESEFEFRRNTEPSGEIEHQVQACPEMQNSLAQIVQVYLEGCGCLCLKREGFRRS